MPRIVVVGGSLGGLRAAQRLRQEGFPGEVVIVESEPSAPYDRPPLSKGVLTGRTSLDDLALRIPSVCEDVIWRRGERAAAADLGARTVTLADGRLLGFDGLMIATGLKPRRLPVPGPAAGRHVLRTRDDAAALAAGMQASRNVVVIGAGFVGCEVAATACALGLQATVVAPESQPLGPALGPLVGSALRRMHKRRGVSFRLGTHVTGFDGDDTVRAVVLSTGEVLETTVVVEAVGSVPNVEWLQHCGLDLSDGVLCDEQLRAGGDERVTAVGDVARFPLNMIEGRPRRIEHWNMAGETARRAAATLAAALNGDRPHAADRFAPLPTFWSDQHGVRLQSFGVPDAGLADVRVLSGSRRDPAIVGYHDDRGLVGVLGIGVPPAALADLRATLALRANAVSG